MTLKKSHPFCKTSLENFNIKSVIKCLPTAWKKMNFAEASRTHCDKFLKKVTSKKIYSAKIKLLSKPPTSESFFQTKLGIQPDEFSEFYNVPFLTTIYTKLRSFQFKINHNILFTKEKPFKVGMKESDRCNLCNKETETLSHLLVSCEIIKPLWKKIEENMLAPFGISSLSEKDILLGLKISDKTNIIVNHVILETKYYIYVSSLKEKKTVYQQLKNRLKITESIEESIAFRKNKLEKHTHKWFHLINHVFD